MKVSFLNNEKRHYKENYWFSLTKNRPQYYKGLVNDVLVVVKLRDVSTHVEKKRIMSIG